MTEQIIVHHKKELKKIIQQLIDADGPHCNMNHIDVSKIKDMSFLFKNSNFNGDISRWNTSNVTNMNSMFVNSEFNGDISKWNVSKVINMNYMFINSAFNQDLSNWIPTKLEHCVDMFDNYQQIFPYWYLYNDTQRRNSAISSFLASKKIDTWIKNKYHKEFL